MIDWEIPWTSNEVVNTACLLLACLVVTAVPVVYGLKANLRDALARAVVFATGATALAFDGTLAALVAYHAGWSPPVEVWDWITRITYLTVAAGKALFLFAILRVIRERDAAREHVNERGEFRWWSRGWGRD